MRDVRTQQPPPTTTPDARDRALRRVRFTAWGVAAGAAGLTVGLSAVAAHAFKGHQRSASPPAPSPAAPRAQRATRPAHRVHVPGPQAVPSIAGAPAPLQPPAQPPSAAPAPAPADPAPAPQVSGGS
jgi:hypothetical protein